MRRKKKKQQCKVGHEEEGSSSNQPELAAFFDADILAAAIEILRKRIAAGTATFLVKVKAF